MKNLLVLAVFFFISWQFFPNIKCSRVNASLLCPDNVTVCHNIGTCCPSKGHGYMCCPYENALCCSDGEHCCPQGKRCDFRNNRCVGVVLVPDTDNAITDSKHKPVSTNPSTKVNNVCPNPHYSCSGEESCCTTPAGTYACCPYSYGTCCADGLHCCPYGMVCIANTTCRKRDDMSALSLPVDRYEDVTCQDGHHCNDDSTCCQLSSGDWGCCPLKNAICCSDKIHCCPQGTICDSSQGTCLSSNVTST